MLDKRTNLVLAWFMHGWDQVNFGPKPSDEIIDKVTAYLQGLDAVRAAMLAREDGATAAQLTAATEAWCGDVKIMANGYAMPWLGCICDGPVNPRCPAHGEDVKPLDDAVEYECLVIGPDGNGYIGVLEATDPGHAFEEATYELEGRCVAVRPTSN